VVRGGYMSRAHIRLEVIGENDAPTVELWVSRVPGIGEYLVGQDDRMYRVRNVTQVMYVSHAADLSMLAAHVRVVRASCTAR
jgi:hypothetical protein